MFKLPIDWWNRLARLARLACVPTGTLSSWVMPGLHAPPSSSSFKMSVQTGRSRGESQCVGIWLEVVKARGCTPQSPANVFVVESPFRAACEGQSHDSVVPLGNPTLSAPTH